MGKVKEKQFAELKQIPDSISDSEVLYWLKSKEINWSYMKMFKDYSSRRDEVISNMLNISVRTLRNYKKPENKFKNNIKEQLLLLLSLYKHGNEVFGSSEEFNNWLNSENFYFDGVAPVTFLNTITGIRFTEDRLTAMEYGDNV
ncbi:DUF2384 domain-containing protein [Patescibacteria group bacterium]|nr:DUF2384 domain-containing protein [Patescibacteria group bacterium]